jgi:hypothetical protein
MLSGPRWDLYISCLLHSLLDFSIYFGSSFPFAIIFFLLTRIFTCAWCLYEAFTKFMNIMNTFEKLTDWFPRCVF